MENMKKYTDYENEQHWTLYRWYEADSKKHGSFEMSKRLFSFVSQIYQVDS